MFYSGRFFAEVAAHTRHSVDERAWRVPLSKGCLTVSLPAHGIAHSERRRLMPNVYEDLKPWSDPEQAECRE